jgi:hypothetical protein
MIHAIGLPDRKRSFVLLYYDHHICKKKICRPEYKNVRLKSVTNPSTYTLLQVKMKSTKSHENKTKKYLKTKYIYMEEEVQ